MTTTTGMTATPYRIVASDMDGTLLNERAALTPYTQHVLYRLAHERGVVFVFATGRHHLAVGDAPRHLREYFTTTCAAATAAHGTAHAHDDVAQACMALTTDTLHKCNGRDDGDGNNNNSSSSKASTATRTATTTTQREPLGFYLISSNGARVHDPHGRLLLTHDLDTDVLRELYANYALPYCAATAAATMQTATHGCDTDASLRQQQQEAEQREADASGDGVVHTSAYTTDRWHITSLPESLDKVRARFGMTPTITPLCATAAATATATAAAAGDGDAAHTTTFPVEGVGKVCFRCTDRALLDRMEADIVRRFGDRVSVAFSAEFCLDVMRGGVSKAQALREVVEHIARTVTPASSSSSSSLTLADCVAFGDGMNDAEMLQAVGRGYIMGNANPRLKAALPHLEVIGSNDDDAVARKLQELFDLPEQQQQQQQQKRS